LTAVHLFPLRARAEALIRQFQHARLFQDELSFLVLLFLFIGEELIIDVKQQTYHNNNIQFQLT
jgi:hypothetical protein